MRTINTDRLYLRPMAEGEWLRIVDRVFEADESYTLFACEVTREVAEKSNFGYVIHYTIMLPFTRDMIGYVEFTPWTKNIAYYIFEEYRHQGFAYEGVKAFMEACMRGEVSGRPEREFYADVVDYNVPSKRLLRKLGFREDDYGFYYDPEREEEIEEKVS